MGNLRIAIFIPDLMGGSDTMMIGKVLWTEFFNNRDWPLAGAATVLLVALLVIPVVLVERRGVDRHA